MKRIVAVLLVAVVAWAGYKGLAPLQYGIEAEHYTVSDKDEMPASDFIKPLELRGGDKLPNIVVILADDLGWGDVGVQGSRAVDTPHIDQLAAQGVRMDNFYASASVCTPSRAGLLTGRYPLRSGLSNTISAADDTFLRKVMFALSVGLSKLGMSDMAGGVSAVKGLPLSEITIAEALKLKGYQTLGIGKWHLGDFTHYPEYHPSKHGFDHFFGYNMSNDDWPVALWRDQQELIKDIGINQQSHTREFTEETVKYIRRWKDEPFFIYMAHKDPHQPFYPSEKFAGKSKAGPYGDAVSEFDWSVGQVVQALRDTGQLSNTLLIVTSDNGPWYEGSSGGLRGRKGQSYEGGFRVPFVASWPGKLAADVNSTPAMNIDILPTALSLANLSLPSDRIVDGVDLMPVLSGDKEASIRLQQRTLYFFREYDVEASRRGHWKFIANNSHYVWPVPLDKNDLLSGKAANSRDYYPPGSDKGIPTLGTWPLLYDLRSDPLEAYNVKAKYPQTVRKMEKQLERWQQQFVANPRGWKSMVRK